MQIGRANTLLIETASELEIENATIDGKASGQRRFTQRVEERQGEAVGRRR